MTLIEIFKQLFITLNEWRRNIFGLTRNERIDVFEEFVREKKEDDSMATQTMTVEVSVNAEDLQGAIDKVMGSATARTLKQLEKIDESIDKITNEELTIKSTNELHQLLEIKKILVELLEVQSKGV